MDTYNFKKEKFEEIIEHRKILVKFQDIKK